MKKYHTPGPGWKHLGSVVWEHTSGARIHIGGLIKTSSGKFLSLGVFPECTTGWQFIKINGGSRKRGLMAWARNIEHSASFLLNARKSKENPCPK